MNDYPGQFQAGNGTFLKLMGNYGLLALLSAWCLAAQVARAEMALQTICGFPASSNTAPYFPDSVLTEIGVGDFYGVSNFGGTNGNGTVFRVTSKGVLTPIFLFNGFNGGAPRGSLPLGNDGNLYGVTYQGGNVNLGFQNGTIFKITTNGIFTSLFWFDATNGYAPTGLFLGKDGNFYGATELGGNGYTGGFSGSGNGTIFKVTTNGSLTVLHRFNGTNGSGPVGVLALGNDGQLYGTTRFGGINYGSTNTYFNGGTNTTGNGTVFRITTNGILTTLASFGGTNRSLPTAGLTLGSDGKFYGTTSLGGEFNLGTIFQITTNGDLTTLLSFNGTNGSQPVSALSQGIDGNFYGTTAFSMANGTNYGTVFRITTNGVLTTLVYLDGTNGLHGISHISLARDGNLYGAMLDVLGKPNLDGNRGTIFRLVQQPAVTVNLTNSAAVVSWASFTNGVYRVEYKTSLIDPAWIPLNTNTASGNITSFTNSSLNAIQRFYRVVLP